MIEIDNYAEFISSMPDIDSDSNSKNDDGENGEDKSDPDEDDKTPDPNKEYVIEKPGFFAGKLSASFNYLAGGFENIEELYGAVCAKISDGYHLISTDGNISAIPEPNGTLSYNKVIKEDESGKKALYDIFGNEILGYKHDLIRVYEESILYMDAFATKISTPTQTFSTSKVYKTVYFLNNYLIYADGNICSYDFAPVTIQGNVLADVETDGMMLVRNKDGLFGFADFMGEIAIEPQFFLAESFSDGFAVVKRTISAAYEVIDKQGNVLFSHKNRISNCRDGYLIVTNADDTKSLLSTAGVLENKKFDSIFGGRVYGNVVIDDSLDFRFYNLNEGGYFSETFELISPVKNGQFFIAKTYDGNYRLYDENLSLVFESDKELCAYGDFLTIKEKSGQYHVATLK